MKTVYFDEVAATDQLIMQHKGLLIQTTETEHHSSGKVGGGAGIATNSRIVSALLNFLPVSAEAHLDGEAEIEAKKLGRTQLKNAILFDYIEAVKKLVENQSDRNIVFFRDAKLEYIENSLAQIQTVSPYMALLNGEMTTENGFNIELSKIDDTLRRGKGYYEMIIRGSSDSNSSIIRLNHNAFRNDYTLGDLVGMELQIIAVRSGKISTSALDFNSIIPKSISQNEGNNFSDTYKKMEKDQSEEVLDEEVLEMFDAVVIGLGIL